uniref:Uncharacterized protein n=1 Tax=Plectus sambesii TaxID=2011161 RepID=A0A914WT03_9BILA
MASSNKATSTSVNDGTPGDVGLFDDTVSSNESESGWQTYSDDEKCECEECVEDNVQFRKEDDSVGCGPPAPLAPMTTEPTLHGFRKGFLLSPKGKKKRETAPVKAQSTATYVSSPNNDDNGLK